MLLYNAFAIDPLCCSRLAIASGLPADIVLRVLICVGQIHNLPVALMFCLWSLVCLFLCHGQLAWAVENAEDASDTFTLAPWLDHDEFAL